MTAAVLYAGGVTLIALSLGVYHLVLVEPGVPVHVPRAMRFTTPCVAPSSPLAQSFRVTAAMVGAVTLYPRVAAGSTGQVLFELRDGTPARNGRLLQQVTADIGRLGRDTTFRIDLPHAEPAGGRDFTLWIRRVDAAPVADGGLANPAGSCVAFEASGVPLHDAELVVGGRAQWGDLLLRVHAHRGTVLHLFQAWLHDCTGIRAPLVLLGMAAIAYALMLGGFCYLLFTSASPASPRADDRARVRAALAPDSR